MTYDVLIRTYNSEKTIRDCLKAVYAQSTPPARVVVLDSGSTDATLSIASEFPVEIHPYPPNEKFHYSRSLNLGIEKCTAPLVWILSSHTIPLGIAMAEQMGAQFVNSEVVYVRVQSSADRGRVLGSSPIIHRQMKSPMLPGDNSCAFVRREEVRRFPFPEYVDRCEDQIWVMEAMERGMQVVELPQQFYSYRRKRRMVEKQWLDLLVINRHIYPGYLSWNFVRGMFKASWVRAMRGQLRGCAEAAILALKIITLLTFKRKLN